MAQQTIEIPATIQEIDYFLKFFAVNSLAQPNISFNDLFQCINLLLKTDGLPEVDNARQNRIIDKLIKDELISMTYPGSFEYAITYEGTIAHLLGGYKQKYLEANRLALSKFHQDRMAQRLYWINFWIAIAGGIAALYYLTKLYWEHCWFHFF